MLVQKLRTVKVFCSPYEGPVEGNKRVESCRALQHIALTINEELGLQERLLDELDEDVDVSHSRIKAAQKKLNTVMRQSGNCKSMLITIGLMFVLMVVIVVCFKLAKLL